MHMRMCRFLYFRTMLSRCYLTANTHRTDHPTPWNVGLCGVPIIDGAMVRPCVWQDPWEHAELRDLNSEPRGHWSRNKVVTATKTVVPPAKLPLKSLR